MDRVEFLKTAGSATVLLCLGIGLGSCSKDEKKEVLQNPLSFDITRSPFDVLQNEGSWLLHPDQDILLVNVAGDLRAFTSVCTHSGCNRAWSFPNQTFRCGCHGSVFNTNGEVISGPANGNLSEFILTRKGNIVTIG